MRFLNNKMTQTNSEPKELNEKNLVYYLLNYLNPSKTVNKVQELKEIPEFDDNDNFEFSFTHPLSEHKRNLFNQIKSIIQEAIEKNTYLLICSFIMNCYEIIELLKKASDILYGKIYIIVGNQQCGFVSYTKNNEIMNEGFSTLIDFGVLIRYMNNAHLKFVTNGEKSVICTTNFTPEGLFKNPEFGLVLNNKEIAISLNRLFHYLWLDKCDSILVKNEWLKIPDESKYIPNISLIKDPPNKIIISSKSIIEELNDKINLFDKANLYDNLVELLNSAEKSIDIAVYQFETQSANELYKIKEILSNKAKDLKRIRILVPSVQINYNKEMKNLIKYFRDKGIIIRYYRELHGKCVIIDEKRVLLFTGNIDKYLVKSDSCDIGYLIGQTPHVKNFLTFYNHLWNEAGDDYETSTPIDFQLDLVVRSYELLSFRLPISVKTLEKRINECENVHFYWHSSGSLLNIKDKKGKETKIYIDLIGSQSLELQEGILNYSGVINDKPNMNLKEALVFTVKKLNLRILWEY